MLTIWDISERTQTGPIIKEVDYDKKILKKARELVKEYNIKFDKECIIPKDTSILDDVYNAAMNYLLDMGIFCRDTNRLVKFEDSEIRERLKTAPIELTLGRGKDSVLLKHRKGSDKRPPVIVGAGGGVPTSEEIYLPMHQSIAQEATVQGIIPGAMISIGGIPVKVGTPSEILASVNEPKLVKEAARRAGKPGIHLQGLMSGISPTANFAACTPEGYTKGDTLMAVVIPELKISWGLLLMSQAARQQDLILFTSNCPVLYGYAGGPEETAIVGTAGALAGYMVMQSDVVRVRTLTIDGIFSNPESLWVDSVIALAIERNTNLLFTGVSPCAAGPCTDMMMYETAAQAIQMTACGSEWIWGSVGNGGKILDHTDGMGPRVMGEVAHASAGIKTDEADEILKKIIANYSPKLTTPPFGKSFKECYNLKSLHPSKEYIELYTEVKKKLNDYGLSMK